MASKMTKAERDRRKAAKQNEEAKKKKEKSKSSSPSKLAQLVKNAIGGQKERKTFAEAFEENTKKLDFGRKTEKPTVAKKETVEEKYNPLIKTPTRMQKDTSPEIDNFAESIVRKGAQGFEGALVGHSDRRNMKEAEDYLSGDYKKRFMPGVKTGLRMNVDDPSLVRRAEEQAKKEGFDNLTEWEINKANEAVHRTDDYYERKAKLDADVEAQNYNKFVKWMPEAAEVIGSMIPTMAAGAATGGIGGMAGLTGRTMAALQHVVTGGEISGRVSGQEARVMYDAVLAEKNKTNLTIDDYRDAIKKANNTGELVGIAEAGTEMLFGGIAFMGKGLLDHTAGKIGFELLSPATKASIMAWRNTTAGRISTAVAQRLGSSIGEGMEEAIMSLAQPAIESNVAGVDSEFSINDMIRDFGMGAAVSMVLGMPVTMADTAEAAEGKRNYSRMQKELQNLVTQKAQELVASGELTAEDAENINAQISDLRKGKGSLMQSETKEEVKVTEEDLDTIYANHDEAREALMAEAKTKKDGEKITARYIDENGEAQLWETMVKDGKITAVRGGMTTKAEGARYVAKAQRVASATNTAERTGYQLNVREDIVKEVSALSKAFDKEVEFIRDERTNVHGYEEGGKIYVNVNSTQSPAAAVVAHEMTHLLENTSSYKKLQDMAFRFYGSSLEDKRADIADIYKNVDALYNKDGSINTAFVDTEVMAAFVEEKLLSDSDSIRQIVKEDRTLAQKIVDWINNIIQKITGSKEQRFLMEARDVWNKALQEEKSGKKAPESGVKYSAGYRGIDVPKSEYRIISQEFMNKISAFWAKGLPVPNYIEVNTYFAGYSCLVTDKENGYFIVADEYELVNIHDIEEFEKGSDTDANKRTKTDVQGVSTDRFSGQSIGERSVGSIKDKRSATADGGLYERSESVDLRRGNRQNSRIDKINKQYSIGKMQDESSASFYLQELEDRIAELQKQDSQLNSRLEEYRNAPEHQKMMNEIGVLKDDELDRAVDEYKKWYASSGYEALYKEEQAVYDELRKLRIELEDAKKEKAKNDKLNYRALFNEEFNKKYATKAARHFGTTYRFDYAGYLTVNGSLLDFSAGQRYRVRDHREISEVLDFLPEDHGYSDALIEFMNMGNIRMQTYGIDISVAPNAKQKTVLRKFFDSLFGEVTVDFSRENGDSAGSVDYPEGTRSERIIRDIDNYFKTGVVPEISETQRYRFSIGRSKDAAYIDAVNRGDMETAQRMVDEAAKAAGYSNRMYHGAKGGGGFTVFRGWQYFTENKDYAERYANRNAPESLYSVYVKMEKPFDTRDDEAREIFYDMFNEYGLTELQEDGLPDWTDGYDITDYIEENDLDYDSVLLNEGGDPINGTRSDGLGGGEFVSRGTSYVIRDSAQIKSADPVTYDEEGNVIPLSERFNTAKDDIRWSMGRSAKTELNDLIKSHGTAMREVFHNRKRADHKELWDMIKDEVSHIVQTGAARRDVVDEIVRLAYETGYVNNAVESEELGENTWGKGIYIPEEYKGEMASLGGLRSINGQLRNSGLFLTYNRTKKGSDVRYGGLDEAYSDLQASNPVLPDTIDPAEQVEALIELFSKGSDRRTLEELDEEAYAMGEENAPYLTGIRKTVEDAMDEIATFARWKMMQDSREEGRKAGIAEGVEQQRKEDEAVMREYDKMLGDYIKNAPELTNEEIEVLQDSVVMTEEQMRTELERLADGYREGKKAKESFTIAMRKTGESSEKQIRKLPKTKVQKILRERNKSDDERRKLRLEIAKKWHAQNKTKSEPGSAQTMYLKNRSAQNLNDEFRRGIITYLVERDMFIPTESGGVVVDENSAEIAKRDTMTGEWDISFTKNQYVPSAGLTYLAEAEGLSADEFFTMYSKIKFLKEHKKPDGGYQYKRKDIVDYIVSLNLTSKQKWFLYFDVAGYARSTAPAFLGGGRVKEEKGNQRGRMVKALDNIAIDMFAGAMKEPDIYDGSHRITHEDILEFADIVYGKEDSKAKDDFMVFFTGRIITYADEMTKMRAVERTNLLTDYPKEADPYKAKILRIYRNLKKEIIAEGEAFERMADKLNNPLIRARYYDAKKSLGIANEMINGRHQRNINGEVIGKGLHEIFKPVFKADEKAKNSTMITELTLLVNCRHDIYRMKYETDYTGYTKEECEAHIERISKAHPMLVKVADELVQYGRNLLQMCVDCGRISEGDYKYFIEKYPYYVPTFRLLNNQYYDRAGNVIKRSNDVLHKVKGGTQPDVLPLFDQMVRRTNEIVKACKKNQLATELAKAYRDPKSAEYIVDIQETMSEEDRESSIDKLGIVEDIGLKQRKENGTDNIIPWYCAGVQNDIIISDENILYGWDRINYMRKEAEVGKIMRKINSFRRAVLTQYNPTFFLTNHIKDVNDMFLYNQHAERLPKYYALAWKVMVGGKSKDGKNRDYLEEYLSHGMAQTSIFEYDLSNAGRRTKKMKAKSVMMALPKGFNEINFIVEQVPRLAVYMETVDRLEKQRKNGGNTYTDEEIKTIAGYQASDATLNFGRSGTYVKAANTYGCTFLNAGVQGMDRFRRMFTQIKDGNKQAIAMNVIGLMVKCTMLGLGSNWILDWIFGGDDEFAKWVREKLYEDDADRIKQEYLEMADYQRLNYFLFAWPFGEQEIWLRIPRGRVAAYMYSWAYDGEKVYSGEMDWMDLISTQWDMAKDTILPPNPVYENIIGPFLDVARNKDAWGEEIVTSYEDQGEGYNYLEYDEDTTDMAIMLADFAHRITADDETGMSRFDISPKKLDYIVEQYLGSYADLIMPMMNKDFDIKAGIPNGLTALLKKFYIDPTLSNRLAGDYYDLSDLYQGVAEAYEEDTPYAVSSEIFITINTQLKPLREASKEVSKTTSMTKDRAYEYLDEITAQAAMNGTSTELIEEFRVELRSDDESDNLSRKQILELNKVIKDQMNQLYRTGTADAKALQEYASANYYGKDGNTDLYKEWYRSNKSAEWQITKITATSDSAKENWDEYSAMGGDAQSFVDFYNYHSMTNSTYGKDGKSIRGQGKKDKCVNFLHNLDVSADLKKQLYLSIGGWSEKKMPRFTDGSKGTMDIALDLSHPLGEAGEVSLSFMVDNNGHTQISVDPGTAVGAAMVGSVEKIVRSEKYGDSIFIKSTDKNGNTVVIQYYGLEEVGGNHEGGAKKYDYIEAGDMIGKVGKDGLKFKVTVNGKPVDAADYLEFGTPGTINTEGYTATKIGEEERDEDENSASSGGYGGSRGGGGRGGRSASLASAAGNFSGGNGYRGSSDGQGNGGNSSSGVVGRSTDAMGYGSGGIMLPRANGYNPVYLSYGSGSNLPTTPTTPRTGMAARTGTTNYTPETTKTKPTRGYLWDDSILS